MVHDGSRVIITHKATKHTLVITKTTVDDGGQITFNTDKGNVEVPFQLVITGAYNRKHVQLNIWY